MDYVQKQYTIRKKLQARIAKNLGHGSAPPYVGLLLDVSYSMHGEPLRQLITVQSKFRHVRRFTFSDDCRELLYSEDPTQVQSGTDLAGAFEYVKVQGITHVVVVTDGEPDSEDEALKAAHGLTVDVIFCGRPPAPAFLEKLAKRTGGKYGETNIHLTKELGDAIAGLLPAPGESPIEL